MEKTPVNSKINIPLGVFFFIVDPRFPEFSAFVMENMKALELKVWDYMVQIMPECKALGGIKIHIVNTRFDWPAPVCYHRQIALFRRYASFDAPPIPEFLYRLPSLNNICFSHPELSDCISYTGIDNDAVGYTTTAKFLLPRRKFDLELLSVTIADGYKRQVQEYNEVLYMQLLMQVAKKYGANAPRYRDILWSAMWESEVDLMSLTDSKDIFDYEPEIKRFGICDEFPHGFSSLLVNTHEIDDAELNMEYDTEHFGAIENVEFLNTFRDTCSDVFLKSQMHKLFELRHTNGCPEFYKVDFNDISNEKKENSMFLADYYIEQFNESPVRDFVNEWIDKHSDKKELILVEKNGKGKWNYCHEYYLEEAANYIVQSASSTPEQTKLGKSGIDFLKNGRSATYIYRPLKEFPFLCMVYTLYTFSDTYMYDFEKMERAFAYLQCYYNKKFHEFICQLYRLKQNQITRNNDKSEIKHIPVKRSSAGRPTDVLEKCIKSDDKQSVIKEMKRELDKLPDGPTKAKYINSLVENGTLSKFPSHSALQTAGLITLTKTPWNNATQPYRNMLLR